MPKTKYYYLSYEVIHSGLSICDIYKITKNIKTKYILKNIFLNFTFNIIKSLIKFLRHFYKSHVVSQFKKFTTEDKYMKKNH